jgi:hypothetical protein
MQWEQAIAKNIPTRKVVRYLAEVNLSVLNRFSNLRLFRVTALNTPSILRASNITMIPPNILNILIFLLRNFAACPAVPPATVKTSVKAAMNNKVFMIICNCVAVFFLALVSCSIDIPVIRLKYTVIIGIIQGERKETNPAKKATKDIDVDISYVSPLSNSLLLVGSSIASFLI